VPPRRADPARSRRAGRRALWSSCRATDGPATHDAGRWLRGKAAGPAGEAVFGHLVQAYQRKCAPLKHVLRAQLCRMTMVRALSTPLECPSAFGRTTSPRLVISGLLGTGDGNGHAGYGLFLTQPRPDLRENK
jgi:hypothetical protein